MNSLCTTCANSKEKRCTTTPVRVVLKQHGKNLPIVAQCASYKRGDA